MTELRTVWILGDQLMRDHPALAAAERESTIVLMIESRARGALHRYHRIKLALVYAAMRACAERLRAAGWRVDYHALVEGEPEPTFETALRAHCATHATTQLAMAPPNSHLEMQVVTRLAARLSLTLMWSSSTQFLLERDEFVEWARDRTALRMEDHYRRMRRRTGWLMRPDGTPEGGAWNFDADNRRTHAAWLRAGAPAPALPPPVHAESTRDAVRMVTRLFPGHPGDAADLWLPVDVDTARAWLRAFVDERLPLFGAFEDMMSTRAPYLLHSVLSPLLNLGLLTPRECVEAAIDAYHRGAAPLNAVEGYVRQIIGWREFVNGVYWLRGPEYASGNALGAHRALPAWFHSGDTPMNCLRHVISGALARGWNHHIERLMVVGNFLAIAGIDPQQSLRWFLEMYVDAYDWVMAANVVGLSQHADGGYVASKPYVASGNYIRRMSDYCEGCRYDPDVRAGPRACPFNALYWNFIGTHAERLATNPRMRPIVGAWRQRPEHEREAIREQARAVIAEHIGP